MTNLVTLRIPVSVWRAAIHDLLAAATFLHAHSWATADVRLLTLAKLPLFMDHAATPAGAATLPHSYSPLLVLLSIAIAILAAYAALELAGRTSASEGRVRLIWIGAGMDDYVSKPINKSEIVAVLKLHLPAALPEPTEPLLQ